MQQNKTFRENALQYFFNLRTPSNLPEDIQILNPYEIVDVKNAVKQFYDKYYSDTHLRVYILGINPGRFGGGMTGISFTDPVALRTQCGIENSFGNKKELSSEFIYKVIEAFGGTEKFFSEFFLTALYPLAIVKNEKNYNYYDNPVHEEFFNTQIQSSLRSQISFGCERDLAICLGKKNFRYLKFFNEKLELFNDIIVLEHPRFIMQYRRKKLADYMNMYLEALNHRKLLK